MIVRLLMAMQSAGAVAASPPIVPIDFDLRHAPRVKNGDIVITARRRDQRIEPLLGDEGPPLGRAEARLFGKVKGGVDVESKDFGNGTTSERMMVRLKIPF